MYLIKDIAVIIPTRNRPKKINRLLSDLLKFNTSIGKVIVISSGSNINNIIDIYINKLNLLHIHSSQGQIKQRNIGINNLDEDIKLVATLDDDIILFENSFDNVLKFWNKANKNTGGEGFNVVNYGKKNIKRKFLQIIFRNFFLK